MTAEIAFPSLEGWSPTKETLHLYSQAVGVVPRVHAEAHPKWWHVSLNVVENGLVTNDMALPDGGTFNLKIDLRQHQIKLATSNGNTTTFSLTEGLTSTQMGDRILAAVADLGLSGEYVREKFENDEAREYNPAHAENFLAALTSAYHMFSKHRATLKGEFGPVQVWPHGFDLAFEWFGTRVMEYEEHGKIEKYPSQLNLGFYSSEPAYFYSNPWPFEEDQLTAKSLPEGARWHLEGWQGSMLPYEELIGDENAGERLYEYAHKVFKYSSPTLTD